MNVRFLQGLLLLFVCFAALTFNSTGFAQMTTGSILGTVHDSTLTGAYSAEYGGGAGVLFTLHTLRFEQPSW